MANLLLSSTSEDCLQQHPAQLIIQGDIIEDWKMKIAHDPCKKLNLCACMACLLVSRQVSKSRQ